MANSKLKKSFILISSKDEAPLPGKKARVRVFQNGAPPGDGGGTPHWFEQFMRGEKDEKEATKKADKIKESVQGVDSAFKELIGTIETATGSALMGDLAKIGSGLGDIPKLIGRLKTGDVTALVDALGAMASMATTAAKATLGMATQLEDARVELAKTTGYMEAYRAEVWDTYLANADLALGLGEATKQQGALHAEFKMFPTLSKNARQSVARLTAEFSNLGVDAAETGKAFDLMTLGMGHTTKVATGLVYEMDVIAQKLGTTTTQVMTDFTDVGKDLAKYGTSSTRQFEKLATAARKSGLAVRQAFDIAMMADTYEGAAELAGKLNAQLGLRINDTELLRATEEERLDIIRQEFMHQRNFDDLNRREKQAIAEIFNVDVAVARKLLTGGMDTAELQKEREETRIRAEKSATAMKKFNAQLEKFIFEIAEPALAWINKMFANLKGWEAVGLALGIGGLKMGGGAGLKKLFGAMKLKDGIVMPSDGAAASGAPSDYMVRGPHVIPFAENDYTLSEPDGTTHLGTELFGKNSGGFIEELPKKKDMEAGWGGIASLFAKSGAGVIGAGALDLYMSKNKEKSIMRNLSGAALGLALAPFGPLGMALGYSFGSSIGNWLHESFVQDAIVRDGKAHAMPKGSNKLVTGPGGESRTLLDAEGANASAAIRANARMASQATKTGRLSPADIRQISAAVQAGAESANLSVGEVRVQAQLNERNLIKFTRDEARRAVNEGTNVAYAGAR